MTPWLSVFLPFLASGMVVIFNSSTAGVDSLLMCGDASPDPLMSVFYRNWQLFLIPPMAFIASRIVQQPKDYVLDGSLTYYRRQVTLILTLLTIRLFASTLVMLTSINVVIGELEELRKMQIGLCASEIVIGLLVIRMDKETFASSCMRNEVN